jgi:hypothetical protein
MTGDCLGVTVLSSMVLAVVLIIGGTELNPGAAVEVENTVRLSNDTSIFFGHFRIHLTVWRFNDNLLML